jgi:hypothetical protein
MAAGGPPEDDDAEATHTDFDPAGDGPTEADVEASSPDPRLTPSLFRPGHKPVALVPQRELKHAERSPISFVMPDAPTKPEPVSRSKDGNDSDLFVADLVGGQPPRVADETPAPSWVPTPAAPPVQAPSPARRRRTWVLASTLAAGAAAGTGLAIWLGRGDAATPTAASEAVKIAPPVAAPTAPPPPPSAPAPAPIEVAAPAAAPNPEVIASAPVPTTRPATPKAATSKTAALTKTAPKAT